MSCNVNDPFSCISLPDKLRIGKIGLWMMRHEHKSMMLHLDSQAQNILTLSSRCISWKKFATQYIHPEDRNAVESSVRAALENKEHGIAIQCRVWGRNKAAWNWLHIFGSLDSGSPSASLSGGMQSLRYNMKTGAANNWKQTVYSDDLLKAAAARQAYFAEQTDEFNVECRMAHADSDSVLRRTGWNDKGSHLRVLSISKNSAEKGKAHQSLKCDKKQLECILRKIRFGIWDWNPASKNILYSDAFHAMLGYSPGELSNTINQWFALVHPDDKTKAHAFKHALLSGEAKEFEDDIRLLHKNGHYIWTLSIIHALEWGEQGRLCKVVGSHFDMTKRKQQLRIREEALKTAARQKQMLEKAVAERTRLLRAARQRVEDILADTGRLPHWQEPRKITEKQLLLMPVKKSSSFARNLNHVFDLITEKMWWYKGIIDSLPIPVYVTDLENRWTYLNHPALKTIGAQCLHDVQGLTAEKWGIEQASSGNVEARSGAQCLIDRFHTRLNKFYRGQSCELHDKSGRCIGYIEALQDVTEAHEAGARIRIMVDSMPFACNFWNSSLQVIDCNSVAPRLFGVTDKYEYLRRFYDFFPKQQPCGATSMALARKHLLQGFRDGYHRFEWEYTLQDGRAMTTEITLVRVRYNDEQILLSYMRDLTELKKKEIELDNERQLLIKIMDNSPVCFVILVDGIIRFATPYAKKFFGVDIGDVFADFYADELERETFLNELDRADMVNWRIVTMKAAGGGTREMLANAFVAEYFSSPCVMSWFLDVTEIRETERQLRLARDAAEESTRAKGEFLANMSHEIRTPMNTILGMTRFVLESPLDPEQRDYLEKVEHSAMSLLRILNDILDFSKIEAGRLEMEQADFSLKEALDDTIAMFRDNAAAARLELVFTLSDNVPERLRGDPLRLHQVMVNLLSNAIKFTAQGGVYVHVSCFARSASSVSLRFSIRDTGIGLSDLQKKKLFKAFSQADTSTTRRYGGTGLGLVISKRLIEMMQGDIECFSTPGEGTEFIFTAIFQHALPVEDTPRTDRAREKSKRALSARERLQCLRGKRILVAEDNKLNQIVAKELLQRAGLVVEVASNGNEAVALALSRKYDLILMDVQMPEMDGLAATQELRAYPQCADIPIIAATAHAMAGDKEKSLATGMNAHITKPIDAEELYTVIASWMLPEKDQKTETSRQSYPMHPSARSLL